MPDHNDQLDATTFAVLFSILSSLAGIALAVAVFFVIRIGV